MSHGVTENTAGLVYTGDAGGLNEATSDIFGTAVEWYANSAADPGDYLIGEKININGNGTPLRYMDKPSKDGATPGLLDHRHQEPRPALLLRPAEPLVLPGLRGLGRQDDQRRRLQQPDLQRLHGDRRRPGRGGEDLVPHAVDQAHLVEHLRRGPQRRHRLGQGALRRRLGPVPRHRERLLGDRGPGRHRDLRRHHPAAHRHQPARQPRLRVGRRRSGPVPPARSPTTPGARPAPGRGRPGSAATARARPRRSTRASRSRRRATSATLSFWLRTDTAETGSTVYDTMQAQVVDGVDRDHAGHVLQRRHQRHLHAEVVQPDGLQGQDGDDPVHHDRGLQPADVLRRRRHLVATS